MGYIQQWWHRCHRLIKSPSGVTRNFGVNRWERMAAQFLQHKGLSLVAANYRTKAGEVDLIMQDEDTLVFVEVRYRRHSQWASAEESVTPSKQLKIIKAAAQYLQQQHLTDKINCRFDVVAINGHLTPPQINWIDDAFQQTLF